MGKKLSRYLNWIGINTKGERQMARHVGKKKKRENYIEFHYANNTAAHGVVVVCYIYGMVDEY